MGEIIQVSRSKRGGIDAVAQILAAISRPDVKQARREPLAALIGDYLEDFNKRAPSPIALARPLSKNERDAEHAFMRCQKNIRDAFTAARMGVPYLREVEFGEAHALPPGAKRLSLNEMAKVALPDSGMADAHNVEQRAWRKYRPIIHLASALLVLEHELIAKNFLHPPFEISVLFNFPHIVETLITRAALYEILYAQSRLKIKPGSLIRFELQD
jgi:hypothetical protein